MQHFLEQIGLTPGETRVYHSLLKLGQTTTGPIIAESGISSSKVYEILDKLLAKGLISFVTKSKVKYFTASSPNKLKDYLSNREKELQSQRDELEKQLPELLDKYNQKSDEQNAQIFLGLRGIRTMVYDQVEDTKPGEEFLFIGSAGQAYRKAITDFYYAFARHRGELGMKVRGIGQLKFKKLLEKTPSSTIRYVDFPTMSNVSIYRNQVGIISWDASPIGILITSDSVAKEFRSFFEAMWSSAEK